MTDKAGLRVDAKLADFLEREVLKPLGRNVEAFWQGFADLLGIEHALARRTPERKLAELQRLQAAGHAVAMVGDGINDAPVLAAADVAFAIGDGAALATRSADLVLAAPTLMRIPHAVALARRTRMVIRQNLA